MDVSVYIIECNVMQTCSWFVNVHKDFYFRHFYSVSHGLPSPLVLPDLHVYGDEFVWIATLEHVQQ